MALALPFRRPDSAAAESDTRLAIIDIGSNSIRLVVYDRAARSPAILFNEKVMAGLGRGLSGGGLLDEAAMRPAQEALAPLIFLRGQMGVTPPRVVATAAGRGAPHREGFPPPPARN